MTERPLQSLGSMVTQSPLSAPPTEHCPWCQSTNIIRRGRATTCVGHLPGDPDPNHAWMSRQCHDCSKRWCVESKLGNYWVTYDNGRVLAGIANCFEAYIYCCSLCGADVTRHRTELDGVTPVASMMTSFEDGQVVRNWRTFYRCAGCGAQVEVAPE